MYHSCSLLDKCHLHFLRKCYSIHSSCRLKSFWLKKTMPICYSDIHAC
uniref:Uncharacterized protein n=1 Tax=Arundo donax TaxID=35708 RepID=A0A0A9CSU2_ARUDO